MYAHDYQSTDKGDISADVYGLQHAKCDSGETDSDELQQYWREVNFKERRGVGEGGDNAHLFRSRDEEAHFRIGIHPEMRRQTIGPSKEHCEAERYMKALREIGPAPYVRWEPLTDTAGTPYESETTGNMRLPSTKTDLETKRNP